MEVQSSHLYVVAIGASAGGLEAFTEFFDHAAPSEDLAYILIQHLSPDYKSLLVELLAKHTKMKVVEAEHKSQIQGGCVYVIPPRKHMTVVGDRIQLTDKDPADRSPNTAVDTFFYSLAHAYEDKAIAVVLSGTGTDGSRGIEAVKELGGLVIVQDPDAARFDGMPRSSIATGVVDLVLPANKIHTEIIHYVKNLPPQVPAVKEVSGDVLRQILDVVKKDTGCDFHSYKYPTIVRRLNRRLAFLKISNLGDYLSYIERYPEESKIYCRDLLIGVTRFFRDKQAFQVLTEKVLIPLVDAKQDFESIKIWVAGCSSGEEVYSLAMLLDDLIRQKNKRIELKIFATDLNAVQIEKASKGEYGRWIEEEVPKNLLDTYFTLRDQIYSVIPQLRKLIVFAKHDVVNDVPFIKTDLISCRNMLIYMNTNLQKRVLAKFHFGLSDRGYLFLGSSENISSGDDFREIDRKWKIFKKGPMTQRLTGLKADFLNERLDQRRATAPSDEMPAGETLLQLLFNELDLATFIIDSNFIIREAAGDYRKFLKLPEQGLKFNLLKMLPESISIPLHSAVLNARKNQYSVRLERLNCLLLGRPLNLVITIKPDTGQQGLVILLFNATPGLMPVPESVSEVVNAGPDASSNEIMRLRRELDESRFNLQTAIEELETMNEELQSSNEELLSSNEELQSSNEELQSLNEELHTLNTEHQLRIQELIEINDDLNNYFRCSDIGQIILDRDLRVRKFNPAASYLINLMDQDVGRSVMHLTTNFQYDALEENIRTVVRENKVLESEIILKDGRNLLLRFQPYIRKDKTIDGAVLSFVDITRYKELSSLISATFESSSNAIIALSARRDNKKKLIDIVTLTGNRYASKLFGRELAETQIPLSVLSPFLAETLQADLEKVVEQGQALRTEITLGDQFFDVAAVKMMDGLTLTLNDITGRRRAEERMKESYAELFTTKEKLKALNSDLENLVQMRTRELSASEERFRLVSRVTNDALIDWRFADDSVWVSENFSRLFGYDASVNEVSRQFWLDKVHPDDREIVVKTVNNAMKNGSERWTCQYRFKDSEGHFHVISDRGFFVRDEHGRPFRMLSSMLDITDLRKAERELKDSEIRLDLALDGAFMAAWELDLESELIIYSGRLPEIFGLPISTDFTLSTLRNLVQEEDRILFDDALERASGDTANEFEVRISWADKSLHWIKTNVRAVRDKGGKVQRIIAITRETTSERNIALELEQKVRDRTLALSKSNSDLEQFAYIASHDLQEPLRKIQTFISLIQARGDDSQKAEEYLGKISASAARMSSLIRNVLQYSRLNTDEEGKAPINLNKTVGQLLEDFELLIREKKAKVLVDDLPAVVGIPFQIGQLFYNLLSNALKFTDKEPVIEISGGLLPLNRYRSLGYTDKSKAYAEIWVKDNGIGFDQKYANKIFTFFYRLEQSKEYGGNGIGLALCKKITQNHGGDIHVKSKPGKGTTFQIILPVPEKGTAIK